MSCLGSLSVSAQGVITLQNASFEDIPHKGAHNSLPISGWHDCGLSFFPSESPPDIHPVPINAWEVTKEPYDGMTFLGMVTRANDTYESLSQALSVPITAGVCYNFSAFISRSEQYKSATNSSSELLENFVRPSVLQIWGGNSFCDKAELLGESPSVSSSEWKLYKFLFQPHKTHKYITLVAFYKTPILEAYNGHILLDGLSQIIPTQCPMMPTDIIAEVSDPPSKVVVSTSSGTSSTTGSKTIKSGVSGTVTSGTVTSGPKTFKPVLLTELDPKKMFVGQKIRLTHLYFKADSVNLLPDSYKVLNELADYLKAFPKTTIEIGGHTNTIPSEDYCIALSTSRAKSVKEYLVTQGVQQIRLQYKGYGKSNPLITYDRYNKEAKLKNQRVEIKILSLS
ncbi:MAG: OmpA family protein [Bacteroidota bacterium]|nr:OmpA family protein [Bacteroidota bacterium]